MSNWTDVWSWYVVEYAKMGGDGLLRTYAVDVVARDVMNARNAVLSRLGQSIVVTGVYIQGSAARYYEVYKLQPPEEEPQGEEF